MPSTTTRNQGKTSFVKELLIDNPLANAKTVNEAWKAAGMDGTISDTLVNKTRSKMGLAGNLRGRPRTKKGAAAGTKRPSTGKKRGRKPKPETIESPEGKASQTRVREGSRNDRLVELEADLDRLLFKVMNVGNLGRVEDALRETRRRLYAASSKRR